MRLSLRAKLIALVGIAALSFVVLIGVSALIARQTAQELTIIEERLLPKIELGPRLDAQFETLRRGLQDGVAALDADALARTRFVRSDLQEQIAAAGAALDPAQAARLAKVVDDYYTTALDVSRRLLAGETGEALVAAMADMQTKQVTALETLRATTTFDRAELKHAFAVATAAQATAGRVRLVVSAVCFLFVLGLSLWLSRGVLRSVKVLTAGLRRFGRGEFAKPIVGVGNDELGEVATQANQMASSLNRLAVQRERTDWLKTGQAGLSDQLRGELDLEEVAERAIRFLAPYVNARVGALYVLDEDGGRLRLLGQYASSTGVSQGTDAAPGFNLGEGLAGQAALQSEILVVADPPAGYLQVRSALGGAGAAVVVLVPIIHARGQHGGASGVIELGLFSPWTEPASELFLTVRDSISIALEVARARNAMRRLLAQTQRQALLLSRQEEQLRASNEELQSQQEELRRANEELIQQTEELEAQRKILQDRNNDLDQAREELERKTVQLTSVSAYKSQFLANMSHELRTPLNSMLLLSNMLAANEAGGLSAKQVEYARTVYSSGRDLLALINQVLDLAKIEAGRQEVHVETVALREVVTRVERVFLPLATDKGLRLVTHVTADLPDDISSDRQRIEQILNNLIANAIKFTETGEVSLRIQRPAAGAVFRREGLRHASAVAFVVSDTGVGIAPADHERVFAPFEQVDGAPDRRYGGTGLGLNIARELAHLLGGELQLRSGIGQGSTFVCYLPQECPTPSSGPQPPALCFDGPGLPQLDRASVRPPTARRPSEGPLLIIEDDARFAAALGELVERQGMTYRIASDGRSGLQMARSTDQRPIAIVLDVMLPDTDGWTVMEELRKDPVTSAIPVHFISGVDAAAHAVSLGAVGYLKKPASPQDLTQVLKSLVPDVGGQQHRVLVVEAPASADSLLTKLQGRGLELRAVGSTQQAVELLQVEAFACLIVDLSVADVGGLEFLRVVRSLCGPHTPAVIVYTARALSKAEAQMLEAHAEAVVVDEGSSTERLLDEVRLFVRRLNEGLPAGRALRPVTNPADVRLNGRKVVVADDDMRTLYSLSAMLRARGIEVFAADTGHAALTLLDENPDVEAVLMDIMMPEMDGYEAMRRIRAEPRFRALPIIALTAKAMKGDAEKCIEAGASTYLPKPIDPDRLVGLLDEVLSATPDSGQI